MKIDPDQAAMLKIERDQAALQHKTAKPLTNTRPGSRVVRRNREVDFVLEHSANGWTYFQVGAAVRTATGRFTEQNPHGLDVVETGGGFRDPLPQPWELLSDQWLVCGLGFAVKAFPNGHVVCCSVSGVYVANDHQADWLENVESLGDLQRTLQLVDSAWLRYLERPETCVLSWNSLGTVAEYGQSQYLVLHQGGIVPAFDAFVYSQGRMIPITANHPSREEAQQSCEQHAKSLTKRDEDGSA